MKTLIKLIAVASFAGAAFAQQPNQIPTDSGFKMQFGARIPMRDNVNLSADIWLPAAPGRYPSILVRTPYVKSSGQWGLPKLGQFFANHGYVFVSAEDGSCLLSEHLSPVDESACNPKPKSLRQTGRNPLNVGGQRFGERHDTESITDQKGEFTFPYCAKDI